MRRLCSLCGKSLGEVRCRRCGRIVCRRCLYAHGLCVKCAEDLLRTK